MIARRRIMFDNINNFRDLGGYPIKGGGFIKFGRLYRCGIPRDPSECDMKTIAQLGVKEVIDLRGDGEAQMTPSVFRDPAHGIDYAQLSLLEINPASTNSDKSLADVYLESVEEYKENYAKVFRFLADSEGPTVFHCFLGKDRTGIVASILLYLAEVPMEDIIADYQVSGTYLEAFYQRENANNSDLIWEGDDDHLYSRPENLLKLYEHFEEKYSGPIGYLKSIGLAEGEIEKLSKILL